MGLALVLAAAAHAGPSNPRLAAVDSFAFGIGGNGLDGNVAARYANYDLVVVDGEEATRSQIKALRDEGKIVLGYLSVGTIEKGRFWYKRAKPYRLDFWGDFGEWYADTSKAGFRRLIAHRVAHKLMNKHFDGLFLDNTDMIETHHRQRSGMRKLVRRLARFVHGRHGYLFAQNGEDSIGRLLKYYDGWNREDVTWTYNFDRHRYQRVSKGDHAAAVKALERIGARGLLVTATDYVKTHPSSAEDESVANACAAGALPFVSNIWLTRVPSMSFTCP